MRRNGACSTHDYRRDACRVLVERPWERNNFEDVGLYERIIIKHMFKQCN
jgi:hypothetical protein